MQKARKYLPGKPKEKSEADEKRKWVRLTRACNNRCIFCLDSDVQNGTYMDFASIVRELSCGIKENCKRAVLSGGDPTIHPDFIKIIKAASIIGYRHIQVITNGRMFCYPELLKKAADAGLSEITFSIHSNVPEINDILTGIKNSLPQTMAGLRNAMSVPGMIVNCDIVVNKMNVETLGNHLDFLFNYGVREFDVLNLIPFGRAWINWDRLRYDPAEYKDELFKAFEIRKRPGVHLWTNRFPSYLFENADDLIQTPFKLNYEVLGRKNEFEKFRHTRKMWCEGERCPYCVLKRFCTDFKQLMADGILYSLPFPECIKRRDVKNPDRLYYVASDDPLENIAMFYIEKRHFIKSSRCAECIRCNECFGTPELYVKEHGFSCMKPVKA